MKKGTGDFQPASTLQLLKKAAVYSLLFSFVFSPVFAHGQESDPAPIPEYDTPAPQDEPEIQEPEPSVEEPTPEPEEEIEEDTYEEENLNEPENFLLSDSEEDAGSLFINNESTRSSAPEVDTQTGALSFTYNFAIPPGRNGVEPEVALRYSSNNAENDSQFGYGWSVSIPTISRLNKYGSEKLYTRNTFTSSLDGELVQVGTSATYKPRVENGSFRQYTFASSTWTVLEKNGTMLTFGSTTASRQDDVASSTRIYAWHLGEMRDTNGNYITYTYYKDGSQLYPETIAYTGHASTSAPFLIEFNREARPDSVVSYAAGFAATTTYRIANVTASIDGSWVYSYDLTYDTGHNETRSLLTSITKSGRDESTHDIVSLPATHFTYETYTASDKGWTEDNTTDVPISLVYSEERAEDGGRFIDINGDGLTDAVRYWGFDPYSSSAPYNVSQEIYLNTGNGWASSSAWTLPTPYGGRFGFASEFLIYGGGSSAKSVDLGARFADVNGDGYTDIIWAYRTVASSILHNLYHDYTIREVYINNKVNGWATSTTWTVPGDIEFARDATLGTARIADLNGDSLPDLFTESCESSVVAYLNTGSGWASSTEWTSPELFTCNERDLGFELADINGDHLVDAIQSYAVSDDDDYGYPEVNLVYLNTGSGWVESSSWNIPVPFGYRPDVRPYNVSLSPRLTDVNGDGLPDIIRSTNEDSLVDGDGVYINTGNGWIYDSEWTVPPYFKFRLSVKGSNYYILDAGYAEMDLNGDNLIDFVKSGIQDYPQDFPHEEAVYIHNGTVPDLLSSIEYPEGAEVTFAYEQSARYTEGGNRINNKLSSNLNTVQEITFDDGVSDPYEHTYIYGGGLNYYASSTDRMFAGFATTTVTDALGTQTTTYIHQGNASQTSLGEYNDSFAKIGKPYYTEVRDSNNNLYTRTITKWDSQSTGTSTAFVFPARTVTQDYDGNSDHKDRAEEYTYDSVGNVLTETAWGEVTATTTTGTFADTGTDKRTTTNQYATSTWGITSLPKQVQVTDQSSNRVRLSKSYYDTLAFGTLSKGNLTKQQEWATTTPSTVYLDTNRTYTTQGLVATEVNDRNATTTYEYDAKNLYPLRTTNTLGHVATTTYDYSSGQIQSTVSPNGFTSENLYDGLDRLLVKKVPDPVTGTTVAVTEHTYTDTRNHLSLETHAFLSATSSVPTFTYFDSFGRKIQERTQSEDDDMFVVRDWIYGPEGRLETESLPYFSGDEDDTDPTTTDELLITYTYDPLGRRTAVENAVGTITTAYDQWSETVTDQLGREKDLSYDAFKRLISVGEHLATSTYTTSYTWNHNDKLTSITDALGNTRAFVYDGAGRRLLAEDLHSASDTTYGVWRYTYDGAGNLTVTVDPKGQTINRSYDLLNRPTIENYTGLSGNEITYKYDTCTNGIGYLCSATSTGASATWYTYTPQGQVASETTRLNSINHTTSYTYDRAGNQISITYPDNSEVRYTYNEGGLLETVEQREAGGNYNTIIESTTYGPHGQVLTQIYGNTASTTYTYDPENLYRLIKTSTNLNSATTSPDGTSWYNDAWKYRIKLTVDPTLVAGNFSAFPVYVDLGLLPATFHEHVRKDATDIRVTTSDGVTEVPREVVGYRSGADTGELHFKATINQSTSTSYYLYYGNSTATDYVATSTYGSTNVWSVYRAVYHLENERESTSNQANLENINNVPFDDAYMGKGAVFTGINNRLTYAGNFGYTSQGSSTWEWIVRPNALSGTILNTRTSAYGGVNREVRVYLDSERSRVYFAFPTTDLFFDIATSSTYHMVLIKNGSTYNAYVNGIHVGSAYQNSVSGTYQNYLTLGAHNNVNSSSNAVMDEVRVYDYAASPAWITTEYNNLFTPQNFYTFNLEEMRKNATNTIIVPKFVRSLAYEYDPVGNITRIDDLTDNEVGSRTFYGYDGLNRLTTATTSIKGPDWYGYEWQYRTKVTINKTRVDGTVANFPVYIRLADLPATFHSNVRTDGGDIRVTKADGTTELPIDLVSYSASTDSGELHALYTGDLSNATNTELYVYYGNPTATLYATTSPYGRYAVWNNHEAVYHLSNENDASLNERTLTNTGSVAYTGSGKVGKAAVFTGADKRLSRGENLGFAVSTDDTWSYYLKLGAMSGYSLDLHTSAGANSRVVIYHQPNNSVFYFGGNEIYTSATTSTWYHLAFSKAGSVYTAYVNGVAVGTTTMASGAGAYNYLSLGAAGDGFGANANATVDEFRMRKGASSPGWVKTEYYNLSNPSTFYTVGSTTVDGASLNTTDIYSYSVLGNLLTKTGQGSYAYTDTGYTNPHTPTSIGSSTLSYDNNGNLLSDALSTYQWTYANKIATSTTNGTTTTYKYDHAGNRVLKTTGALTTRTPSRLYEVTGTSTTKNIFAGNTLVATIYGTGTSSATTTYIHTDHLGSTRLVTNQNGQAIQSVTYNPFGSERASSGSTAQKRHYIGELYDTESALSYLNARYYDGGRGQFLSQDPVFWEIGETNDGKTVLMNPQLQNSYSYAGNNPVTNKDTTGRSRTSVLGHMYTSFSMMPTDVSRQAYQAITVGFSLPALTLMVPGTAAIATEAIATSPTLAGATLNIAVRATTDLQSGQTSSAEQYAGSAIFGAATAQLSLEKGVLGTMGIAGASSATEGYLVDGSVSIPQVVANTLGAGAGKVFGKTAAETAPTYLASPASRAFVENATAYTTTAVTTKALTPKNTKNK